MGSDASYLLCANSPLTLTSCPHLAQRSSAADAAVTAHHILAADNKSEIAWVEVRANAKSVSRVDSFVFILTFFGGKPRNSQIPFSVGRETRIFPPPPPAPPPNPLQKRKGEKAPPLR